MISSLFLSNNNSETISFQAPNQKNSTKSIIKGVTCALYSVLYIISHVIAAALWEKKRKIPVINIVFYMIDILYHSLQKATVS